MKAKVTKAAKKENVVDLSIKEMTIGELMALCHALVASQSPVAYDVRCSLRNAIYETEIPDKEYFMETLSTQ